MDPEILKPPKQFWQKKSGAIGPKENLDPKFFIPKHSLGPKVSWGPKISLGPKSSRQESFLDQQNSRLRNFRLKDIFFNKIFFFD